MYHMDTFLTIGKTHKICDDYIMSGNNPFPFIVLADGCSSSPYTDIGSRLMVLSAIRALDDIACITSFPIDYALLGKTVISMARPIARQLGLPEQALDTTLVIAVMYQDHYHVFMYGDGAIVAKTSEGFRHINVNFSTGAPWYLSYQLNDKRREVYRENAMTANEGNTMVVVDSIVNEDGGGGCIDTRDYCSPLEFSFPVKDTPFLAIASDGLDSFIDVYAGQKISPKRVITDLFSFKNMNGEFVKRRVKRAIEEFAKQSIFHADDISVGAMMRVEDASELQNS